MQSCTELSLEPRKKAVAYMRSSTRGPRQRGNGLDAQRSAIESFARSEGFLIDQWVTEVETGNGADALSRRPKLVEALRAARKLKAPVLVSTLDRLSRDVTFISGLMSQHVTFIVTDLGRDVDPFVLHLFATLTHQEHQVIALRTRDALQALTLRGVKPGNLMGVHEGLRTGSAATNAASDTDTASVLPLIQTYQHQGLTFRQIAAELNKAGVRTVRGRLWRGSTVVKALKTAKRSEGR